MDQLPALNAILNATSTILLLNGYRFIKRKDVSKHRMMMLAAFIVSMAFLACYVLHKVHLHQTTGSYNTVFQGEGFIRIIYFLILGTHVVLAMTLPVLAPLTLGRGLKMSVERHRKIARWTFPIWLYVSVTGVIVYFMLYQWFPAS
jgi:uncharacterized membrane protein YozB (DUF420 family)